MPEKPEKSDANAKPSKAEMPFTDLSVGEILRRARVSEDLSLERVEEDIRIRASLLQAIEEMDLEKLPGWIYTTGFIRTYSEYLDLDGDKMISLLKTQVGEQKREELNFPVTASESSLPDPWIIGATALGLLLLVGVVFIFQNFNTNFATQATNINDIPPVPVSVQPVDKDTKEEIPERPGTANQDQNSDAAYLVSELAKSEISRDENGVMLPRPKPEIPPPSENETVTALEDYRVIIDVLSESWVEIRDGKGEILVSRVLKKGDQYYVPQHVEGLVMTTGNAAGIKLTVDGAVIPIEGHKGDIMRDIPLDPESLKEMFP